MSFTISLQKNTAPSIALAKFPSILANVTGALRDGSSILDPVILIETTSAVASSANYAYIAEFNRYYYITKPATFINGLWEFVMHVDVLMSYASQIRAQNAIVARQEYVYDMMLDDGWFMAYQNPIVQTRYFSEEAPFEAEEYVLVVAGS